MLTADLDKVHEPFDVLCVSCHLSSQEMQRSMQGPRQAASRGGMLEIVGESRFHFGGHIRADFAKAASWSCQQLRSHMLASLAGIV